MYIDLFSFLPFGLWRRLATGDGLSLCVPLPCGKEGNWNIARLRRCVETQQETFVIYEDAFAIWAIGLPVSV